MEKDDRVKYKFWRITLTGFITFVGSSLHELWSMTERLPPSDHIPSPSWTPDPWQSPCPGPSWTWNRSLPVRVSHQTGNTGPGLDGTPWVSEGPFSLWTVDTTTESVTRVRLHHGYGKCPFYFVYCGPSRSELRVKEGNRNPFNEMKRRNTREGILLHYNYNGWSFPTTVLS